MSKRFADFLEEQGIDFGALDARSQRELRLKFSDSVPVGVSKTVQSDRAEVDINMIVARHRAAGIPLPEASLQFGDATAALSYEEALEATARAREMFSRLPSRVRARFENEPGELLRFMGDPANREEAYELGLLKRPSLRNPPVPPEAAVPPPDSPSVPPSA